MSIIQENVINNLDYEILQNFAGVFLNPYDVINEPIYSPKDIEDFYNNFHKQKFVPVLNELTEFPQAVKHIKNQGLGKLISGNEREYFRNLKLYEILIRNLELGKEGSNIVYTNLLLKELETQKELLIEQLKKGDEAPDKVLRELEDIEKLEEFIQDIIERREKLIEGIKDFTREKIETLKELLNQKNLKVFADLKDPDFDLRLVETINSFYIKNINLTREFALNPDKVIEKIRKQLEKLQEDPKWKQVLETYGIEIKLDTENSDFKPAIFVLTIKELEDKLVENTKKILKDKIKDNIDTKRLGLENPDEIEIFFKEKILPEIDNPNANIEQFLTEKGQKYLKKYREILNLEQSGEPILLKAEKEKVKLFNETIERFWDMNTKNFQKQINLIARLYNFDLLLWKAYKREIGIGGLDTLLSNKYIFPTLDEETKDRIVKIYEKQMKQGVKADNLELNPREYVNLVKATLEKNYVIEAYKMVSTKFTIKDWQEMVEAEKNETLKSVAFIRTGKAWKQGLLNQIGYAKYLRECLEDKIISGNLTGKEVDLCFKRYKEKSKAEINKVENLARQFMRGDLKTILTGGLAISLYILADLKKTRYDIGKTLFTYNKEKIKKGINEILKLGDEDDIMEKTHKLMYENGGFMAKVVGKDSIYTEREKSYVPILKENIEKLFGSEKFWENILLGESQKYIETLFGIGKEEGLPEEKKIEVLQNVSKEFQSYLIDLANKGKWDLLTKTLKEFDKSLEEYQDKFKNKDDIKRLRQWIKEFVKQEPAKDPLKMKDVLTNEISIIRDVLDNFVKERSHKEDKLLLFEVFKSSRNILVEKRYNEHLPLVKQLKKESIEMLKELKAENFIDLKEKLNAKIGQIFTSKNLLWEKEFLLQNFQNIDKLYKELRERTIIVEGQDKALITIINEKMLDSEYEGMLKENKNKFLKEFFGMSMEEIKADILKNYQPAKEYNRLLLGLSKQLSLKSKRKFYEEKTKEQLKYGLTNTKETFKEAKEKGQKLIKEKVIKFKKHLKP
jgi:hypothetical protein